MQAGRRLELREQPTSHHSAFISRSTVRMHLRMLTGNGSTWNQSGPGSPQFPSRSSESIPHTVEHIGQRNVRLREDIVNCRLADRLNHRLNRPAINSNQLHGKQQGCSQAMVPRGTGSVVSHHSSRLCPQRRSSTRRNASDKQHGRLRKEIESARLVDEASHRINRPAITSNQSR